MARGAIICLCRFCRHPYIPAGSQGAWSISWYLTKLRAVSLQERTLEESSGDATAMSTKLYCRIFMMLYSIKMRSVMLTAVASVDPGGSAESAHRTLDVPATCQNACLKARRRFCNFGSWGKQHGGPPLQSTYHPQGPSSSTKESPSLRS